MFKALYKMAAKKNRGFTLIELIVVIAILGILIAILVPSMIGFINNARRASVLAEGKTIYTSAQAYITQQMAINNVARASIVIPTKANLTTQNYLKSEPAGTLTLVDAGIDANGNITAMTYVNNGFTVTFPAGSVTP